ncbi:MAG TPA: hypothetical protein VKU79_06470 [Thermoplasmataceae archaeon]|nr:hypothetical protein [Thermoplasmatales archaeon AK]HLH86486.1 hypothetical protein [Thermoplasmataceae archaeon]
MGRTVPTMRQSLEMIANAVIGMERHAISMDARIIESIAVMGRKHAPEASAAGLDPEFTFLISVIMEMYREIVELRAALHEK